MGDGPFPPVLGLLHIDCYQKIKCLVSIRHQENPTLALPGFLVLNGPWHLNSPQQRWGKDPSQGRSAGIWDVPGTWDMDNVASGLPGRCPCDKFTGPAFAWRSPVMGRIHEAGGKCRARQKGAQGLGARCTGWLGLTRHAARLCHGHRLP